MFAVLVHIRPLDLRSNTRVDVRVASSPGSSFQGLGGFYWESALVERPQAAIELFPLDLSAGTRTATATLRINTSEIKEVDVRHLRWSGAPITIYRADGLKWPAPIEFSGIVTDPSPNLDSDTLSMTCKVPTGSIDVPLLTRQFEDTDYLFDAEKRGEYLPAGFGHCENVEVVWFDTIRNIGIVDGYGNLEEIEWLGENLSSMGPVYADYDTYEDLKDAQDGALVPPGRWATCLAEGLVALGAPPEGVITAHCEFGYGLTGAMSKRILSHHADLPADKIHAASFDALDAALPYPIHYWTNDETQVKDLLEQIASGCNASPIFTLQGQVGVLRPFGGDIIAEFNRFGFNEVPVTDWRANAPATPYWRLAVRTARPVRVMDYSEVNYEDDLIDRGKYDDEEVYRQGHIVWLADKSQWLYINETPTAGNAPPVGEVGDDYWILMAPPPSAEDILYADGTPIEDLQPAEIDAQVTRSISVSATTLTFLMDASGNAVGSQFPLYVQGTVNEANYDVTLMTDWSITADSTIFATIDNGPTSPTRGRVTITNITGPGNIEVQALRGGVALSATISVTTKGALADKTQVNTPDIVDEAVTQSGYSILELYGASVGTDDDNIWRDFAYSSVALTTTISNPGANGSAIFFVTLVGRRTGGDDDRIDVRLKRDDDTILEPAFYEDLFFVKTGNDSYTIPFIDPDPPLGPSSYTVQTKNKTGHPAWQRGIIIPLRMAK